jgi:hypothetical protein
MNEIKLVKYKNQVYPDRDIHYIKNWKPSWKGRIMLLRNSSYWDGKIVKVIDNNRYITEYNLKKYKGRVPAYAFHSTDRLFETPKDDELMAVLL